MIIATVDELSRIVIVLKRSSGSKAKKVYQHFEGEIANFYTLSHTGRDCRLENRVITKHAINTRRDNFRVIIGGCSDHNSRIDRFWRECNQSAVQFFF